MALRYDFASDNVAGAMPEAVEALVKWNQGFAPGYGADDVTAKAADLVRGLFDADAEIRFVASGTAANSLTLATLALPHEAVLVHQHSHVATDETGAPGFFGSGLGLTLLGGASGKIDPGGLAEVLGRSEVSYRQSPAALSLTNATEFGALYADGEFGALVGQAKAAGLKVHLDGARLANAVAAGFLAARLAPLGVDIAVAGGTKVGSTPSEAIVLFDRSLARRFDARMKHAGQLVSKARYLASPWIGMLETGAWACRAAHANRLAQKLASLSPFPLAHPVEANAMFVDMDEEALKGLRRRGFAAYRFLDGSVRLMCSWATTDEAVEELAEALRQVA